MNISNLLCDVQRFIQALDDLGFDSDDNINGGDCVDVVGRYITVLRTLPALAQLAVQADLLVKAKGRFHTEHNYKALVQALDELKGM